MWPHRAVWIAPDFGDCADEIGYFHQGSDYIGMGRSHLGSERAVGGGQSQYRGTIDGSGHGNIGNSVNCVLLVGVVGGLETRSGSSDLGATPFELGC